MKITSQGHESKEGHQSIKFKHNLLTNLNTICIRISGELAEEFKHNLIMCFGTKLSLSTKYVTD